MKVTATTINIPFHGGLNTQSSHINIADNESPNCENVHTNIMGNLQRRNGYVSLGSIVSGTRDGHGIFDYWIDDTTHYLIVYIGNALYKMDVGDDGELDGTLDSISFTPTNRIVSQLVYCGSAWDIHLAMVNGQIVMENREMTLVNEKEIRKRTQEAADALIERSGTQENRIRKWQSYRLQ